MESSETLHVFATIAFLRTAVSDHPWPVLDTTDVGPRIEATGVVLIAHGDAALARSVGVAELPNAKVVVLTACSSGGYHFQSGPFFDGVVLQLQKRLGRAAVVIATRYPMGLLSHVEPFVQRLLGTHAANLDRPYPEVAFEILREFAAPDRPFENPWVELT